MDDDRVHTDRSAAIRRRVAELGEWFHNLDLDGVQTAPRHLLGDYPAMKWRRFAHVVPQDLTGKSVLGVGCNAGFYSLEMKRRGAAGGRSRFTAVRSAGSASPRRAPSRRAAAG